MEEIIKKKSLWSFSTSCAGRDLTYTLVSLFFMTFVIYTCKLTNDQFIALSVFIILCRVWDAVNDPMMSTIITNTKSRKGSYLPWILVGSISNALFLVLLFFSPGLKGWSYVIYLGVCYLFWGMTYTMNDVSYWSLIPHLARSKKMRDKVTGMVAIFASVGQFVTGGLIPILTTGNMITTYRIYAIVASIIFVISQVLVFLLVEDKNNENNPTIKFKDMFKIIFRNKQLLVMTIVTLLYSLGSVLLTSFGTNFFYFKLGYDGNNITIFTVVFAVGTLSAQIMFEPLAKRFKRKDLNKVATFILITGYVVFFVLANLPLSLFNNNKTIYLMVLCIVGLIIFASQGIHYLITLIMLTNTIEYDEWQTGNRMEAITFSIRPFMVKLASAIQQGLLTLVLLISGLYGITNQLSVLEQQKAVNPTLDITILANNALKSATSPQIMILTIGMCLVPAILFFIEYLIIKKKYIIDEEFYEKMLLDIRKKKENA